MFLVASGDADWTALDHAWTKLKATVTRPADIGNILVFDGLFTIMAAT